MTLTNLQKIAERLSTQSKENDKSLCHILQANQDDKAKYQKLLNVLLVISIMCGRHDFLIFSLNNGAQSDKYFKHGSCSITPLHLACLLGNMGIVNSLIEHKDSTNFLDSKDRLARDMLDNEVLLRSFDDIVERHALSRQLLLNVAISILEEETTKNPSAKDDFVNSIPSSSHTDSVMAEKSNKNTLDILDF